MEETSVKKLEKLMKQFKNCPDAQAGEGLDRLVNFLLWQEETDLTKLEEILSKPLVESLEDQEESNAA